MRKRSSLSIGEKVATDAANLLRDYHFKSINASNKQAGVILKVYAYVDDMLYILNANDAQDQQPIGYQLVPESFQYRLTQKARIYLRRFCNCTAASSMSAALGPGTCSPSATAS